MRLIASESKNRVPEPCSSFFREDRREIKGNMRGHEGEIAWFMLFLSCLFGIVRRIRHNYLLFQIEATSSSFGLRFDKLVISSVDCFRGFVLCNRVVLECDCGFFFVDFCGKFIFFFFGVLVIFRVLRLVSRNLLFVFSCVLVDLVLVWCDATFLI